MTLEHTPPRATITLRTWHDTTPAPRPQQAAPRPTSTRHTLEELLEVYARDVLPHKAPRTGALHLLFARRLLRELGPLPLDELTPPLLRAWRDRMAQRCSPGSVRRYMACLSAVLTAGVSEYEWLDINPLSKVRKPPLPAGRTRFLSEEERHRLLEACQQSTQPALYPLVMLALSTGARKSEIRYLRWSDVDLQRGVLRLLRTKNGEHRVVPLVGVSEVLLRAWACLPHRETDWVFPGNTGASPLDCMAAWYTACRRARLHNFHFHDLRHTTASYLAMSGATLREIAEVLGHKHIQQTLKYTHLIPAHTRGVIERMAEHYLAAEDDTGDSDE